MFRIAVIDGQCGAIGSAIIKRIAQTLGKEVEILALGTNAIATSLMLKAGANRGATGENAVSHCSNIVDVIVGPISILITHAFMGEVTPNMVAAIGASKAAKILLPLTQEDAVVVGTAVAPLPHLVDRLISDHLIPFYAGKGLSCVPMPEDKNWKLDARKL